VDKIIAQFRRVVGWSNNDVVTMTHFFRGTYGTHQNVRHMFGNVHGERLLCQNWVVRMGGYRRVAFYRLLRSEIDLNII
jgi:hypothetical protein